MSGNLHERLVETLVSIPTLDALNNATITYLGTYVSVLFRDRDRLSSQQKQMISFQVKLPVMLIFQSREGTRTEWWTEGMNYNPHGPAIIETTTGGYEEQHNLPDGSLGWKKGPAFQKHVFGVSYIERWTQGQSMLHRDGGPALVEIDYGDPHQTTWLEFTKNGPAWERRFAAQDGVRGTVIKRREQTWARRGKTTNDNGWAVQTDFTCFETFETLQPMSVLRTLRVTERELRWYDEREQLHRTDGPAILKLANVREIEKDGTIQPWQCSKWTGSWHVRGNEISKRDIVEWARKNHIPLLDEAPYNKSAFRGEDGELCFITDIAKEFLT